MFKRLRERLRMAYALILAIVIAVFLMPPRPGSMTETFTDILTSVEYWATVAGVLYAYFGYVLETHFLHTAWYTALAVAALGGTLVALLVYDLGSE